VAAALLKSVMVAAGWRQSHRPVLSRRPQRSSACAKETAGIGIMSFKSRRDISISERKKTRAGTGNDGGSATLRTPSG
jgi:hypothetical protein